jgi:Glycosyltransferase family 87
MLKVGWILFVVLLVLGTLSVTQGFLNAIKPDGSKDFQWTISRQLLNHKNPYRLFLEGKADDPENKPFPAAMPVYPASAEIFLWPIAALNSDDAKWLWAAANILFAIGSVVLITRMTALKPVVALGLLGVFLASTPVRNTIGNGQQGLFSFFFFLLAVDLRQKEHTPLAALCLAASWLKYTVSLPLTLIFLRRGWRTTFALACAAELVLTLFLAFWTGETPLNLLLEPLMLAGNAVTPRMFDIIAIASHIGVTSLMGPGFVCIALLVLVAALMFKSNSDLMFDLSLLSLVSLIWSYHWQYDYFILVIPLAYALKRWRHATMGAADILIVLTTFSIWFAQRILDLAVRNSEFSIAKHIVFWSTCLAFYAAFVSYFAGVFVRQRQTIPATSKG